MLGRRIWVNIPSTTRHDENGHPYRVPAHLYDIRVLSIKQILPADPAKGRAKHLIQVWADPGGIRTLSVGSLCIKDPRKVAAQMQS